MNQFRRTQNESNDAVTSLPDRPRSSGRDARPATVAALLGAWALCVLLLLLYLEHRPKPTSSVGPTAAPTAVFPGPPAGAVVFSREAGPDALALGVVPLGRRVRVQASVVGPDALGVSELSTRFVVDGVPADGVACGAGCYRATFPAGGRPRVVEVSTAGKLTTSWRVTLPAAWPPVDAGPMIAESRRVWRALRSLSFTDRLASDPEHVVTSSWQAQAPNRLAYQIVKGYSAVIVGKQRWDKPPNGRWKRSPQQPIAQPTPPVDDRHECLRPRDDGGSRPTGAQGQLLRPGDSRMVHRRPRARRRCARSTCA